jgi:hypothetical protein
VKGCCGHSNSVDCKQAVSHLPFTRCRTPWSHKTSNPLQTTTNGQYDYSLCKCMSWKVEFKAVIVMHTVCLQVAHTTSLSGAKRQQQVATLQTGTHHPSTLPPTLPQLLMYAKPLLLHGQTQGSAQQHKEMAKIIHATPWYCNQMPQHLSHRLHPVEDCSSHACSRAKAPALAAPLTAQGHTCGRQKHPQSEALTTHGAAHSKHHSHCVGKTVRKCTPSSGCRQTCGAAQRAALPLS